MAPLTQTQKTALDLTGTEGKNSDDVNTRNAISWPDVGNANYNTTNGSPSGPKRCGIFAASALLNNREETGGSYYGIMELTGNVYERAITVGNPEGRAFTGLHGNGSAYAICRTTATIARRNLPHPADAPQKRAASQNIDRWGKWEVGLVL